MRLILSFLFIILFIFNGISQPPLNIDENFDDNSLLWEVGSNEIYDSEISNGVYKIHHRPANQSGRYYFKKFMIDYTKDYIIEVKIRFVMETQIVIMDCIGVLTIGRTVTLP